MNNFDTDIAAANEFFVNAFGETLIYIATPGGDGVSVIVDEFGEGEVPDIADSVIGAVERRSGYAIIKQTQIADPARGGTLTRGSVVWKIESFLAVDGTDKWRFLLNDGTTVDRRADGMRAR